MHHVKDVKFLWLQNRSKMNLNGFTMTTLPLKNVKGRDYWDEKVKMGG